MRERFAREMLKDGLPNPAAKRAGYTAKNAGSKLMEIDDVVAQIRRLHHSQMRRLQLSADEVVIGLSRIARFDPRKLFNEHGQLKQPHDWPEEIALCIASIEVEERWEGKGENRQSYYVHKIKFNDRSQALIALARHHNLFAAEAQEVGRGMVQESEIIRRMEAGRARASAAPAIEGEVLAKTESLAAPT